MNQNLIISKIAIYHLPALPGPQKKSISRNSLVRYSPIYLEYVKKNYVNKMKLKWQKHLK